MFQCVVKFLSRWTNCMSASKGSPKGMENIYHVCRSCAWMTVNKYYRVCVQLVGLPQVPTSELYRSVCQQLSSNKTKELVLHRPHVTRHNLPQSLAGTEQVLTVRLLGVIFQSSLNFAAHVDYVLKVCSQHSLCSSSLGPFPQCWFKT